MDNLEKILGFNKEANVPDLDWLNINVGDVDNIPSPLHIEIVPQLEEAWSHKEESVSKVIPNNTVPMKQSSDLPRAAVSDIVKTAKKEIMLGHTGAELGERLASFYPKSVIKAAFQELKKVAAEQGLLGNVYIDISPFNNCEEAAKILGGRVKTAKYVVGTPKGHSCSTHKSGYCQAFKKNVVADVAYGDEILSQYTDHLRIAGVLNPQEKISSKEDLRNSFLRIPVRESGTKKQASDSSFNITPDLERAFNSRLLGDVEDIKESQTPDRFSQVKPILAFMQNEMLKGHIGNELKESMNKRLSSDQIKEFEPEIRKVASLQGLMGNVYVDVSYYDSANDAVNAIKDASTSPLYIVQTVKRGSFDDTLSRVASATGCSILPENGKIEKKIASSYIDDLHFNQKLSSDVARGLKNKLASEDKALGIIREAFLATLNYKPNVKKSGVQAHYSRGESKPSADRENLRVAATKALENGLSIKKVEEKVASYVSTPEAVGMVRDALSKMKGVDANSLTKCTIEKYQLDPNVRIKKASKCKGCILSAGSVCTYQGAKFAGEEQIDKAYLDIDPKTAKVQYGENPDVARMDMRQEYDMSDNFGSNMTVALDKMRGKTSTDVDFGDGSGSSMDSALS